MGRRFRFILETLCEGVKLLIPPKISLSNEIFHLTYVLIKETHEIFYPTNVLIKENNKIFHLTNVLIKQTNRIFYLTNVLIKETNKIFYLTNSWHLIFRLRRQSLIWASEGQTSHSGFWCWSLEVVLLCCLVRCSRNIILFPSQYFSHAAIYSCFV